MEIQKIKEWKESQTQQFRVSRRSVDQILGVIRLKDNKSFDTANFSTVRFIYPGELAGLSQPVAFLFFINKFQEDLIHVQLAYSVCDNEGRNVLGNNRYPFDFCEINNIEKITKEFQEMDLKTFLKSKLIQINKNIKFFEEN